MPAPCQAGLGHGRQDHTPTLDDLTSPLEPRQGGRSLQSGTVKPSANRNMIMQMLKNVTFALFIYLHLPCSKKHGTEIRPRFFSLTRSFLR